MKPVLNTVNYLNTTTSNKVPSFKIEQNLAYFCMILPISGFICHLLVNFDFFKSHPYPLSPCHPYPHRLLIKHESGLIPEQEFSGVDLVILHETSQ